MTEVLGCTEEITKAPARRTPGGHYVGSVCAGSDGSSDPGRAEAARQAADGPSPAMPASFAGVGSAA